MGTNLIDSVKVFGAVNGFPIVKEGEYDIMIKYEPQKWLDVGIIVSIVTIGLYLIIANIQRFRKDLFGDRFVNEKFKESH